MTMIPPKIRGMPNLRKHQKGYIRKPAQGSVHSNRSLYPSKMVR
jgi:hypothetical protein